MTTPKHEELTAITASNGASRLCLDRVIRADEDNAVQYAFVWRKVDGRTIFVRRPAYFNFSSIATLLREAIEAELIPDEEVLAIRAELKGVL